jgi:hypothetical protein
MDLLPHALRQAAAPSPSAAPPPVLVAGARGALGSAVVERLLGSGSFAEVRVMVTQPFASTARGLRTVLPGDLADLQSGRPATLALAVFDRPRRAHGREDAFYAPAPQELAGLAAQWHACGVRDLVVVMPHASGSMPAALAAGLASLDEQAVAALGFERVAILRPAAPPGAATSSGLQRVADIVLAQLRIMVPQTLQPVRARHVARVAVEVARQLASHAAGTRVLAPERVWQAAQTPDAGPLVAAWLAGQPWPAPTVGPGRL